MSPTLIVGGVAVAIVVGIVGVSRVQVANAERARNEARAELAQCQGDIAKQGASIKAAEAAASQAQADADAALARAREVTEKSKSELARLRGAKPTSCSDAVRQVREGLRQ
jgi:hypothetical protein